jgi:uncharacterized protein YoxC
VNDRNSAKMTELDDQMAHRLLLLENEVEARVEKRMKVMEEDMRGFKEEMSGLQKKLTVIEKDMRERCEKKVRLISVVEKLELIFSVRNPEKSSPTG